MQADATNRLPVMRNTDDQSHITTTPSKGLGTLHALRILRPLSQGCRRCSGSPCSRSEGASVPA